MRTRRGIYLNNTRDLSLGEAKRIALHEAIQEQASRSRYPARRLSRLPSFIIRKPKFSVKQDYTGKEMIDYLADYLLLPMQKHYPGIADLFTNAHKFLLSIASPYEADRTPPLIIETEKVGQPWNNYGIYKHIRVGQYEVREREREFWHGDQYERVPLNEITMDIEGSLLGATQLDEAYPIYEPDRNKVLLCNGWNRIIVYKFAGRWVEELVNMYKYHLAIHDITNLSGPSLQDWRSMQ